MENASPNSSSRLKSKNSVDDYRVFTLEELLPHSFGPEDLTE
jgi:cytidine deaminase